MSYYRMRPATIGQTTVPFARATNRRAVASKMDPRNWALSFVGCVIGANDYKDSPHYVVHGAMLVLKYAANGRYIKAIRLTETGGTWGGAVWMNSRGYYRLYDSLDIFKLHARIRTLEASADNSRLQAEAKAAVDLSLLSQNTVTRALVHAASNEYCSETAVALISAGHKMPDVTLSFEVTAAVSVTLKGNDNYYVLRDLFGATAGDVQGAKGIDFGYERREKLENLINEQLSNGGDISFEHTDTDVDWGTPIIRQLPSTSEALRQVN